MSSRSKEQGSDLERAWSEGESVDLKRERSATSVLSIRVPTKLLEALSERAASEGKPASLLARELIERALESDWPSTPRELARAFSRWVEEIAPRKRASR